MENNTQFLGFSSVDGQQIKLPITTDVYSTHTKWVKYGDDNLFPQFLIEMLTKSALHNSIVNSKVSYCYANGLDFETKSNSVVDSNITTELNEIYKRCLFDYVLFGGFSIEVIWNDNFTFISKLNHIPFERIRSGKLKCGDINKYYYCFDWSRQYTNKVIEMDAYSVVNRTQNQLLYFKTYTPGNTYYPLPSYIGGLNWIAIDNEISNFHLSHIVNGMTPNMMINFSNGIPSQEERDAIKQELINQYGGSSNAGKFMLTFSDTPDRIPQVNQLSSSNLDSQFMELTEEVLQQI